MKITTRELENKRMSLDCTILAELPQDVKLALYQANMLDCLIEQDASFELPSYLKWGEKFIDDLLAKAPLVTPGRYRVYIKTHANSTGEFYNGIVCMPDYQLTNMPRGALLVGTFTMKG